MEDYDFFIDSSVCMDLYNDLTLAKDSIIGHVNDIYSEIGTMNEGWKGSTYDNFKAMTDSVRDNFDSISDLIQVFNNAFVNSINPVLWTAVGDVCEAAENITGEA